MCNCKIEAMRCKVAFEKATEKAYFMGRVIELHTVVDKKL
jgi:hypothetical protein